jgi:hypothetical protein
MFSQNIYFMGDNTLSKVYLLLASKSKLSQATNFSYIKQYSN